MGANLPALALGAARVVEVGNQFACALLETGRVHCWGDNFNGQLGLGSSIEKTDTPTASVDVGNGRTVVELSVGNSHACVVLDTLLPKCWGYNGSGILGVGSGAASIGHTEAEMGDALRIVNLGDQGLVFALSAGMIHTCAILDAPRAVKCWGSNDKGQLGVGDKENRGAHSSEMGNALPAVDLGNAP
jgi:alpha-tubulin suppressor-like RCC1 family protein